MRRRCGPNNIVDDSVRKQRIGKHLPVVPPKSVFPELASLAPVLQIAGVQQIVSDLHGIHDRFGCIRE
jgi:hypothetical protein